MDMAYMVRQAQRGDLSAVDALVKRLDVAERTLKELFFGDVVSQESIDAALAHIREQAAKQGLVVRNA